MVCTGEHHVWSNTNPNVVYGAQGNSFVAVDARTGASSDVDVFGDYPSKNFGRWEGNLSYDDRYVALIAGDADRYSIFAYDMVAKTRGTTLSGTGRNVNNVSMTPSGQYVAVQWGTSGRDDRQGITLHDRASMQYLRTLGASGGGHADYCYDSANNEVMVMSDDSSSALVMVRLSDGMRTTLLQAGQIGWNLHVSCRNIDRRGYAYISQFAAAEGEGGADKAYVQTVFAVALDGSGKVERFAHEHHSNKAEYDRSAFAAPDRTGQRVMWRSDWDNPNGQVFSYVAERKCP